MPKIDPITGCSVMTLPEFIIGEAKKEGKEPHELMDEMYEEIASDQRNEEARLKTDFDGVLKLLLEDVDAAPEFYTFKPEKVIEVCDAKVSYKFRSNQTMVIARVACSDGKERFATCTASSSSGSFYEPPDYECLVEWRDKRC